MEQQMKERNSTFMKVHNPDLFKKEREDWAVQLRRKKRDRLLYAERKNSNLKGQVLSTDLLHACPGLLSDDPKLKNEALIHGLSIPSFREQVLDYLQRYMENSSCFNPGGNEIELANSLISIIFDANLCEVASNCLAYMYTFFTDLPHLESQHIDFFILCFSTSSSRKNFIITTHNLIKYLDLTLSQINTLITILYNQKNTYDENVCISRISFYLCKKFNKKADYQALFEWVIKSIEDHSTENYEYLVRSIYILLDKSRQKHMFKEILLKRKFYLTFLALSSGSDRQILTALKIFIIFLHSNMKDIIKSDIKKYDGEIYFTQHLPNRNFDIKFEALKCVALAVDIKFAYEHINDEYLQDAFDDLKSFDKMKVVMALTFVTDVIIYFKYNYELFLKLGFFKILNEIEKVFISECAENVIFACCDMVERSKECKDEFFEQGVIEVLWEIIDCNNKEMVEAIENLELELDSENQAKNVLHPVEHFEFS
ncbi:hypothetical protein SteCoe_32496 [Stentor coeruleus]|uniref:Uncharacterized protein n=1 Tax=Stentor coeruleus TaxID=5963 RepID=A0A1R2AYW4_9CILI|nr:hypothetical protein SteCoe_32496 [Stentor coeruleus]